MVSLMLDDPLQSFRPLDEDYLNNVSTQVLPNVCQFVFQVALVRGQLAFQLLFSMTEEPEVTRWQIWGINWMAVLVILFLAKYSGTLRPL
jgi:hypothetical protein